MPEKPLKRLVVFCDGTWVGNLLGMLLLNVM
jgi:hypothetical protein